MILAVCVDDKLGMMFHKRRQSRDREQQADLLRWCGERKLWMNAYSAALFAESQVCIDEDFLHKAESGDICFLEDRSVKEIEPLVDMVILYRWNRSYPANLWFDLDFAAFQLEETVEFAGSSHEVITREIYRRRG